ncbi:MULTISPECIES: ParB/RepB/Spo0J family partition protein [unclassified Phenylobacterium]|uniref:ParB/RepB/Spo0J family partition protein n=1 Tax=unclassified Phenylobacterium TaxID=2640670 RepID=UPI000839F287|nr:MULTISPECIES: ParB/RepB/Spo0J family partition protein [unclassified Phenylobacterium]
MASTTGKNRSILAGLVSPVTETPTADRGAPAPERLSTRLTGLARVTSGDVKEKTLKLVDPSRCRMWERHNRRYDLLNETSCADLLESLRSQGEQEFPAIVRRVEGDPAFDYEVICGARRHWSVSYLRNVEHREIRYLIEERELTDEQAFRLADVENRSRKDISDYERALDYRHAVETFYGGVAQRMAERLEVSKTWLSRFLDLAKLPTDIVEAFGDIRVLREHHAREIKPLLADSGSRPKVMAEAKRLGVQQAAAVAAGHAPLEPSKVIAALKAAAAGPRTQTTQGTRGTVISSENGAALFTLARKGPKRVMLELALDADASNADFATAFQRELQRLRPKA